MPKFTNFMPKFTNFVVGVPTRSRAVLNWGSWRRKDRLMSARSSASGQSGQLPDNQLLAQTRTVKTEAALDIVASKNLKIECIN